MYVYFIIFTKMQISKCSAHPAGHNPPFGKLPQSRGSQRKPRPHPAAHTRSNPRRRVALLPEPKHHSHTWLPGPGQGCCGYCMPVRSWTNGCGQERNFCALTLQQYFRKYRKNWMKENFSTLSLVPTPSVPATSMGSTNPAAFRSNSPAKPPSSALHPESVRIKTSEINTNVCKKKKNITSAKAFKSVLGRQSL